MESILNKNNYNQLNLQFGLTDVVSSNDIYSIVEIDLIDKCQLKCPLCLRQEISKNSTINKNRTNQFGKNNRNDIIDFAQFFESIKTIPGYNIKLVKLIGTLSEPTLYKDIIPLINFLNNKGISVQISTNGNKLSKEFWKEFKEVLNNNQQNELLFAIEGSNQETYSKYRVGGNLDRVLDNLNTISQDRNFKLGWQYIKFDYNEKDYEQLLTKLKDKIDFVEVYHCNEPENLNQSILPTKEVIEKFYKKRMIINQALNPNTQFPIKNITCKSETYKELFIDINRNIWPCTNLYEYYLQNNIKPNYICNIEDFTYNQEKAIESIKKFYMDRTKVFECYKSCSNFGHKLEKEFLRKRITL